MGLKRLVIIGLVVSSGTGAALAQDSTGPQFQQRGRLNFRTGGRGVVRVDDLKRQCIEAIAPWIAVHGRSAAVQSAVVRRADHYKQQVQALAPNQVLTVGVYQTNLFTFKDAMASLAKRDTDFFKILAPFEAEIKRLAGLAKKPALKKKLADALKLYEAEVIKSQIEVVETDGHVGYDVAAIRRHTAAWVKYQEELNKQ